MIATSPITSPLSGWNANNWQTFSNTIPVPSAGKYQLQVRVLQAGENATGNGYSTEGTSLFMMDRVRFRLN